MTKSEDPQRFVLIKNGLPKTICLSQEIISMSNPKVDIKFRAHDAFLEQPHNVRSKSKDGKLK
jgi:hypothetical protein